MASGRTGLRFNFGPLGTTCGSDLFEGSFVSQLTFGALLELWPVWNFVAL